MLYETPSHIIQIEIFSKRTPDIPQKMFSYFWAILHRQEKEISERKRKKLKSIIQIVLYTGQGKPPPSHFKFNLTQHRYFVIDLKKLKPSYFLKSQNPDEVILAVLTGKKEEKTEILKRVLSKLQKLERREEKLLKYIEEIELLSGLFDLEVDLSMFRKQIDITKTSLFRLGLKEGEKAGWEKGRKEGLEEGEKKGLIKGLEEGEKSGLIKGLKEAILLGVQIKFGFSKVSQVREKIKSIDDISKLKRIKSVLAKENSWENFVKALESFVSSKPKRTKSKNSKH